MGRSGSLLQKEVWARVWLWQREDSQEMADYVKVSHLVLRFFIQGTWRARRSYVTLKRTKTIPQWVLPLWNQGNWESDSSFHLRAWHICPFLCMISLCICIFTAITAELFLCVCMHVCVQDSGIDIGDISERKALRKRLQCKTFRWYLVNIYPEMRMYTDTIAYGVVSNMPSAKMEMLCQVKPPQNKPCGPCLNK